MQDNEIQSITINTILTHLSSRSRVPIKSRKEFSTAKEPSDGIHSLAKFLVWMLVCFKDNVERTVHYSSSSEMVRLCPNQEDSYLGGGKAI